MVRRVLVVASICASCTGVIGEPPGAPPGSPPPPGTPPPGTPPPGSTLQCTPGEAPEAELVRINRTTYVHALQEIFGAAAVQAIQTTLDALPATRAGSYNSELGPATFAEVAAYVDVSAALAYEVTKDAAALRALDPCLEALNAGVDPFTDPCVGAVAGKLGRRLLRRPLAPEDHARFLEAFSIGGGFDAGEGVATMLMTMLLDPRFLYFFEVDGEEVRPGILALTPHEVAARIARILWDSIPDARLEAAADAGLDRAALDAELARLWEDERARLALGTFYREWMEVESLPYPPDAVAPDASAKDALRAAMQDEMLAFATWVTFEREGGYAELLLDRTAFVGSSVLAELYGLPPGTAGEVELPAGERAGVLTRAAWLASAEIPRSNAGHIIKRGARFGRFICRELPPPDPNLFPAEDPADPTSGPARGIRERFRAATMEPQCAACHVSLDAYGGAFGHYGAAGEWIDGEEIVTAAGATGSLSIDAVSTLSIDGELRDIDGALELSQALADSDAGAECFSIHLTRRMMGRRTTASDACVIAAGRDELRAGAGGSIRAAYLKMLGVPELALRRLP